MIRQNDWMTEWVNEVQYCNVARWQRSTCRLGGDYHERKKCQMWFDDDEMFAFMTYRGYIVLVIYYTQRNTHTHTQNTLNPIHIHTPTIHAHIHKTHSAQYTHTHTHSIHQNMPQHIQCTEVQVREYTRRWGEDHDTIWSMMNKEHSIRHIDNTVSFWYHQTYYIVIMCVLFFYMQNGGPLFHFNRHRHHHRHHHRHLYGLWPIPISCTLHWVR